MKKFQELIKNLKKDFTGCKPLKVALLGDSSTQFLAMALRGLGYEDGYNLHIMEADFNQIEIQIFNKDSDLYKFEPHFIILFNSTHNLLQRYNRMNPEQYSTLANVDFARITELHNHIKDSLTSNIILFNYPELDDKIFGNYANKTENSFLFQVRKLNYLIMAYAASEPSLFIFDLSSIQNEVGRQMVFSASLYITSELALNLEVLPKVAYSCLQIIRSLDGMAVKCIIFDLDDTIWGGIIGDDGIDNIVIGGLGVGKAFVEFQHWLKKLRDRGIILAVCSKNNEASALEVFENHPDMVLRVTDISLFLVNWENKVDNIKKIRTALNISYDSIVFLDDNKFERDFVKGALTSVIVPDLPLNPEDYLDYLYSLNLFETNIISDEDTLRTRMYQENEGRLKERSKFLNENEYLENLEMVAIEQRILSFNISRTAQLSQRSNQFNLRTIRYTVDDLKALNHDAQYLIRTFSLADRMGSHGLVSVIILKKAENLTMFIENWFMSCRVFKRGLEHAILNSIILYCRTVNIAILKGEFIPTAKNMVVEDLFLSLGFELKDKFWEMKIDCFKPLQTAVRIEQFEPKTS
ncbi:MAG TPA: HAD-IIIC family phosphatase [Sphingobacteriaceae bacterium]|nr:HAD-IIIC family phosphatase [Sphingobacteriaceae bacterium]